MKKLLKLPNASLAVILLCVIAAPWLAAFLILISVFGLPETLEEAAQLGDSFGIVNALFSCLAFAGILVTVWQQKHQAHEDRQINSQQMFDATFFELNRISREAKDAICLIAPSSQPCYGTNATRLLQEEFTRLVRYEYPDWVPGYSERDFTEVELIHFLNMTFQRVGKLAELSTFLAAIRFQIEFIENRPRVGSQNDDERYARRLIGVVRTTLDSDTLSLMLLIGLSDGELKKMIIQYDLAKHMVHNQISILVRPHYKFLDAVLEKDDG